MTDTPAPQRQFVAVQFAPWERRTYTYHNDSAPVAVDDRVIVETAKGKATVTVVSLPTEQPPFPTKPIVGLAPAEEATPETETKEA